MAVTIGNTTAYHHLHLKIHIDQTISFMGIIYRGSLDYVHIFIYSDGIYSFLCVSKWDRKEIDIFVNSGRK